MKEKTIRVSYLLGILHTCVEIICFYILYNRFIGGDMSFVWTWTLFYDFLAFVPQFIFGHMYDNFTKIKLEFIAVVLLIISVVGCILDYKILSLLCMGIGNAILHETCAVITTSISDGKLSHSAIFVGFGSFGVVIGQILGKRIAPLWMLIPILIIFLILLFTEKYLREENRKFPQFHLLKEGLNDKLVIAIVLLIVSFRSFIGYAIPISWKKELWQTVLLFFIMGLGKILGGILSDRYGARKVGVITTILCIPFLVIGDNIMILSIIGVFLFSMTMSITFGMLLDKFHKSPGLCFGLTTIGLFIGVLPVFFFPFNTIVNIILIVALSLVCCVGFIKPLK